jgi:mono/diheme cytochrome c family protein
LAKSGRDYFLGLARRTQIAFQRQSVLWHNAPKGVTVKTFFPSGNAAGILFLRQLGWRRLPAIGAMLLLFVPAARAQSAAPQGEKSATSAAGNADTGKKIFTKDGCYECHGREGQGAAQTSGPRIGPSQRFIRPFIKYVRQPTGQMPPYTSAVISDEELADIYAYLQSRPEATPSKDIPLLNQ